MMPARRSQNWLPGIFNDFFGNEWVEKTNTASPAINIIESDNDYKVEVAAPGMTKDDFSIKIDPAGSLTIRRPRHRSDSVRYEETGRPEAEPSCARPADRASEWLSDRTARRSLFSGRHRRH